MKFRNLINLVVLLACVLAAVPGPAQQRPASSSQRESERQAAQAANVPVRPTSPAVDLLKVGRKVAPGVFEVSPDVVRGRRLILPASKPGNEIVICLGIWEDGMCLGIYIDLGRNLIN